MKELRFTILGVLAIVLGLTSTIAIVLWWKARNSSFSFPGPGPADFSAHLAGDYSVYRTSGFNIIIAPEAVNDGTPIIPNLVVECATDGRFILAKRHGMKRRSPNNPNDTFDVEDPSRVDFWILDTKEPGVEGPWTESEFISRRRSLKISESVKLRDVYEFRHVGSWTAPTTKTLTDDSRAIEELELGN
jgi:hypothetical protein